MRMLSATPQAEGGIVVYSSSGSFAASKQKEIFLQADRDVPYGFVVQVMAAVKTAGIDRMGLITESPD